MIYKDFPCSIFLRTSATNCYIPLQLPEYKEEKAQLRTPHKKRRVTPVYPRLGKGLDALCGAPGRGSRACPVGGMVCGSSPCAAAWSLCRGWCGAPPLVTPSTPSDRGKTKGRGIVPGSFVCDYSAFSVVLAFGLIRFSMPSTVPRCAFSVIPA